MTLFTIFIGFSVYTYQAKKSSPSTVTPCGLAPFYMIYSSRSNNQKFMYYLHKPLRYIDNINESKNLKYIGVLE